MATTHVFIVDTTTFKFHLEYLFAGTGASNNVIDFNGVPDTALHHGTEDNLVNMIADAQRIRRDDPIIFYVQQNLAKGVKEGKFYGIFKAVRDLSFLDNNDSHQFLKNNLGKSLTFRTIIRPDSVYADGVTEWEALDEIKNITSPHQMLWSLIYRKLKAKRGNTMITAYESDRLFGLLRSKNANQTLSGFTSLSYDIRTQKIISATVQNGYSGRQTVLDIYPRLLHKFRSGLKFECHLQAVIVEQIGRGVNTSLDDSILGRHQPIWIGNEVYCGVGLQRIDIMAVICDGGRRVAFPIELKADVALPENMIQLQRYVDWLFQYYVPNNSADIQPILVSLAYGDKSTPVYADLKRSFDLFNSQNCNCKRLKYVEYTPRDTGLEFISVSY